MRIALTLAIAAIALAACGKPADKTAAAPGASSPSWVEKNSFATGWIPVARDTEGTQISYDPKSITRDAAAGTADIWIQMRYQYPQEYQSADDTTKRVLEYYLERAQFRFRCQGGEVATVSRKLMSDDKTAAETLDTPPAVESDWRPIVPGGIASIVEGPACRST